MPLSFDEWKRIVDNEIIKRTGLSADDLPDYCYRDDYEDGRKPQWSAVAAIKAAKNG